MTSDFQKPTVFRPLFYGATKILAQIFIEGQHTGLALDQAFRANKKWGGRDRRWIAEIVYECVRWWRQLEGLRLGHENWSDHFLPWKNESQLGRWTETQVEENLKNFLCLRGDVLPQELAPGWSARELEVKKSSITSEGFCFSASDEFIDLFKMEVGSGWEQVFEALNQKASPNLRVNLLKAKSRDQVIHDLTKEGYSVESIAGVSSAIRLLERKNVFVSQGFKSGHFEMQDAASQHVGPMMQLEPGMRVVDGCAGAGGKSLHIADLLKNKGKIISLDIHQWKLRELKKRAARAGAATIETRVIESSKVIKRLHGVADRVLLDVPCTGSGVLRRKADPKYRLTTSQFQEILATQQDILRRYALMTKPGGKLVYSTCSVFPSENRRAVEQFLTIPEFQDWNLEEDWTSLPNETSFDGFYVCRIARPTHS